MFYGQMRCRKSKEAEREDEEPSEVIVTEIMFMLMVQMIMVVKKELILFYGQVSKPNPQTTRLEYFDGMIGIPGRKYSADSSLPPALAHSQGSALRISRLGDLRLAKRRLAQYKDRGNDAQEAPVDLSSSSAGYKAGAQGPLPK